MRYINVFYLAKYDIFPFIILWAACGNIWCTYVAGYDCGMFVIKIAELLAIGLTEEQCIPWEYISSITPNDVKALRKHLSQTIRNLATAEDMT